jgi:asparagine synthase (glutamine-hydrolysing)
MGFGVPLAKWLREDLRDLLTETLLGKGAKERGVFQVGEVEKLLQEHLSGQRDHRDRLWILFMFELWADRFL